MSSSRIWFLVVLLVLFRNDGGGQDLARHQVVPLKRMPSEQWVETVSGDPQKPGMPFVIRI